MTDLFASPLSKPVTIKQKSYTHVIRAPNGLAVAYVMADQAALLSAAPALLACVKPIAKALRDKEDDGPWAVKIKRAHRDQMVAAVALAEGVTSRLDVKAAVYEAAGELADRPAIQTLKGEEENG